MAKDNDHKKNRIQAAALKSLSNDRKGIAILSKRLEVMSDTPTGVAAVLRSDKGFEYSLSVSEPANDVVETNGELKDVILVKGSGIEFDRLQPNPRCDRRL